MAEVNKSPQDKDKQAEKDTKKQIEAHIEVAKHRLGRVPTVDEVMAIMSESQDAQKSEHPQSEQVLMPNEASPEGGEEEDPGPKILSMQVYHGMKQGEGGTREPDEAKILFYETPDGMVYDCASQEWLDDRPDVVDHLHSRPLQYNDTDIISAIVNGVMDDEDYDALDKAGMISENPQKLWSLTKNLKGQIEELEMSQELEDELEKSEEYPGDEEEDSEEEPEETDDTEPDAESVEESPEPTADSGESESSESEIGTDQIAEIIKSAMSEAFAGPYLEQTIRKIVQEEMSGGSKRSDVSPERPEVGDAEPDENTDSD